MERSFRFSAGGKEYVGYPLTIAAERQFSRDGTYATLTAAEGGDVPEADLPTLVDAMKRVVAESLRRGASWDVEAELSYVELADAYQTVMRASRPPVPQSPKAPSP